MASLTRWQIIAGLCFVVLSLLVRMPALQTIDTNALLWIHEHCSEGFSEFMLNLNAIAGPKPVYAVTILIGFAALRQRGPRHAAGIVVAMVLSGVLNLGLRDLLHRHRPELWHTLFYDHSFIWSFPSGHSCLAASLGSIVVILLWHTRYRFAGIVFAVAYCVVVASTTLVLGVHYPSDILAGWISGWLTVTLAWSLFRGNEWRPEAELGSASGSESVALGKTLSGACKDVIDRSR